MINNKYIAGLALLAALAAAGCDSDTQDSVSSDLRSVATEVGDAVGEATDDAAEAAARNIATQQGEEQFTNAGQALNGPLTCTAATIDGADKIKVDCTGTTQAGGAAVLTGTTSEIPGASVVELKGDFTGTVDGQEVFSTKSCQVPVPVFRVGSGSCVPLIRGLGGVGAGGSTASVGERAVFAGTVVTDRVHTKDLTTGGDLDTLTDDRDLDLAAGVTLADFVVRAGEGHAT